MGNQTAKRDEGKLMLSLVPTEPIEAVVAIRMYGNEKYHDPDNWKTVEKQRYVDAAFRHFIAYLREPYGMDGEGNLPHLWHCLCNLFFLCSLETQDGTLPTAQDALQKMHHPDPVQARRSPVTGASGYLFADDLKTPGNGVKRDCDNCRYFEVRVTDRPCFACDENKSEWERKMSDLISRCELFNRLAPVQTLGEAYGVIQGMETEDAIPLEWFNEKMAKLDSGDFVSQSVAFILKTVIAEWMMGKGSSDV